MLGPRFPYPIRYHGFECTSLAQNMSKISSTVDKTHVTYKPPSGTDLPR